LTKIQRGIGRHARLLLVLFAKSLPMKFGLSQQVIRKINEILARFPQVEKALIYGSRAKGENRPGSDIDMTLLNRISIELDDLLLPYTFDLSIFHHIGNAGLLRQIECAGREFYHKTKARETVQD
jgi:polymorphic toxin system nucleotidyltransferase-like protein